jgi:hypothetical protein
VLLAADNAPLVLHQILGNQATHRVLGRAVVDLRLAAHRNLRRLRRLASVLAAEHFLPRAKEFVRVWIVLGGGRLAPITQLVEFRSYGLNDIYVSRKSAVQFRLGASLLFYNVKR